MKRQIKNFIGEDIVGEYFSALEARYGVTINRQALAKLAGGAKNNEPGFGHLRHAVTAARWRSDRARLHGLRPPL